MIVVASTNGSVGIKKSIPILKAGGTALDAVEAGIRLVNRTLMITLSATAVFRIF